jgi:hypothetical protein
MFSVPVWIFREKVLPGLATFVALAGLCWTTTATLVRRAAEATPTASFRKRPI